MTLALLNVLMREVKFLTVEIEWSAAHGMHAAVLRDAARMEEIASEIMQYAIAAQWALDVKVSA